VTDLEQMLRNLNPQERIAINWLLFIFRYFIGQPLHLFLFHSDYLPVLFLQTSEASEHQKPTNTKNCSENYSEIRANIATNELRIRNCNTYSEPMTSHAIGGLTGSRRKLLHTRRADVMATILQV